MGASEKRTLKRFGRGLLGLILSALLAYFNEQPLLIGLAPLINATGKYLRDKWGVKHVLV